MLIIARSHIQYFAYNISNIFFQMILEQLKFRSNW